MGQALGLIVTAAIVVLIIPSSRRWLLSEVQIRRAADEDKVRLRREADEDKIRRRNERTVSKERRRQARMQKKAAEPLATYQVTNRSAFAHAVSAYFKGMGKGSKWAASGWAKLYSDHIETDGGSHPLTPSVRADVETSGNLATLGHQGRMIAFGGLTGALFSSENKYKRELDKRGVFLSLQGEGWGVVISCPADDELRVRQFAHEVTAAVSALAAAERPSTQTKKCPDCAEAVLREANVCRFCGYRFTGDS
jgi:hypothetical protein